ncbi:LemA family protein, partial [Caulobacter sp. 17J65-9]|uniref:LemA family protein n=1 Tax=Caulobacter sp. 17J65-9 TaxID=2709382 RepID=UPI0013C5A52A
MKIVAKRLMALLAVAAGAVALAGCGINTIPTKEERAKQAWGDVQTQYQRRADLVPNLVATVQGAAVQERTVLTEVTNARARATSVNVNADDLSDPAKFKQFQAAQNELSSSLGRLLLVVENYPQLQSNQNFLALQSQLEGTENRIAIARRDYNQAATDYNISLRTFPTIIWAKTIHAGSKPMQLFEAAAGAQAAPSVNFNLGAPAPGTAPGSAPPAAGTAAPHD